MVVTEHLCFLQFFCTSVKLFLLNLLVQEKAVLSLLQTGAVHTSHTYVLAVTASYLLAVVWKLQDNFLWLNLLEIL